MSESIFKLLDLETVIQIKKLSPFKTLVKDTVIAYEGQIPNFAVMLNSGSISLKSTEIHNFDKPVLIFYDQIKNEDVAEDQVSLHKGAEVSILDRAILKELLFLKVLT